MSFPENVDPVQPEPSADATQRLSIGVPAAPALAETVKVDSHSTLKLAQAETDPGLDQTQKMAIPRLEAPGLDQTQKMAVPRLDEPPLRRLKVDSPAEAEGQTLKVSAPLEVRPSFGWKVPAALALLVVVGVAGFLALSRTPEVPASFATTPVAHPSAPAPSTDAVPKDVQILIDQAKAGDTRAMRMLGAYYLNGLNVPKDREKGISYYRMAAEKGSDAAKAELSQIEGGR